LFGRIATSESGRLDVLVNNAFAGVESLHSAIGHNFWQLDPAVLWDSINGVGLRGHYLCTVYAARSVIELYLASQIALSI
jgi:dehydrogenase/reductase SDR family protein 1